MHCLRTHILAAALFAALATPASAQAVSNQTGAALSLRIETLEARIRQMTGQIQELNHKVNQLEAQLRGQGVNPAPARPAVPPVSSTVPGQQLAPGSQVLGQIPGQPLDLRALNSPTPGTTFSQGQPQLVRAPSGDPKDSYDLAYGYILSADYAMAEASFRDFLQRHPGDPLAGNAQYWLGESLFSRGRFRDSADAFLQGYTKYPRGAKAPDSLLKLGMSLKELGQPQAACSSFAEIGRKYPRASRQVRDRAKAEARKSGC